MERVGGVRRVNLYRQRQRNREYYRIPIRPNPLFEGKIRDAYVEEGITGMGPAILGICYPEGQERPLIYIFDFGNWFTLKKGEDSGVITYSMFEGIMVTFTEANVEATDDGYRIRATVEEELEKVGELEEVEEAGRYRVIKKEEVPKEKRRLKAMMDMTIGKKELEDGEKVPIRLSITLETKGSRIEIMKEGMGMWNESDRSFLLERGTYIAFSEEMFR